MTYEGLTDVILVGHSYGGMVITGIADRAAGRIRELVYLDAAHPVDGESLLVGAPEQMEPLRDSMTVENGVALVMHPFPGLAGFLGVTDPADAAWVDAVCTPHPWACFAQPLRLLNGDAAARLPRTNINCTQSRASSRATATTDRHRPRSHDHRTRMGHSDAARDRGDARARLTGGQSRSMIVTLAMPPPSHIVCRP